MKHFIQEYAFENVIHEMVNICTQLQRVNKNTYLLLDIAVVWSRHVWSLILSCYMMIFKMILYTVQNC